MESKTRHSVILPEEVSQKINIVIEKVKDTLRVITQKGIMHAVNPFHYRYIVNNIQLKRKRVNVQFYTADLLAKTEYLEGNTVSCIYTSGKFTVDYPCTKRSEVGDKLRRFSEKLGIPDRFMSDLETEITGKHTDFQAQVKRLHIDLTHS